METQSPDIAIVDYDPVSSERVKTALSAWGYDSTITKNEGVIGRSRHIVLPPFQDIAAICRKMTICNLFQFFRLVRRPVLALGPAAHLLCKTAAQPSTVLSVLPPDQGSFQLVQVLAAGRVKKMAGSSLLHDMPDSFEVFYGETVEIPFISGCTTAVLEAVPDRSAMLESALFSAVLFDPFSSGEPGKSIIKNFLSIR